MPKAVIICNNQTGMKDNCPGHLNFIVKGKTYTGPQYGDSTDAAFFYKCSQCGKIYYANGGHEIESVRVENFRPYNGKLTAAQLIVLAPKHCNGSFSSFDEERMIESLEPKVGDELEVVVTKSREAMERGVVVLPANWIGKNAKVVLLP